MVNTDREILAVLYEIRDLLAILAESSKPSPVERRTFQIEVIERFATKSSGSPAWRCKTPDGVVINVFHHADKDKNTWALFDAAGYGAWLESFVLGDELDIHLTPISITARKEGQWWQVESVATIPAMQVMPSPPSVLAAARYGAESNLGRDSLDSLRNELDDFGRLTGEN